MYAGGAELTGVLVLRVWIEECHQPLRARIAARINVLEQVGSVDILSGRAAVLAAVEEWLEEIDRRALETMK